MQANNNAEQQHQNQMHLLQQLMQVQSCSNFPQQNLPTTVKVSELIYLFNTVIHEFLTFVRTGAVAVGLANGGVVSFGDFSSTCLKIRD